MFDIGWSEMAVIALVALIVIGPKELPSAMRIAAKWARKARSLAREFQSGVDDMIREADLEDARKAVDAARSLDVEKVVGETIDPGGGMREEARAIEGAAHETGTVEADDKDREKAAEAQAAIAPPHSLGPPREGAPPTAKPALGDDKAGKQAT